MLDEFGEKSSYNPRKGRGDDDKLYLEEEDNFLKPSQWLRVKDNILIGTGSTLKELPSGSYIINWDHRSEQPAFQEIEIKIDNLIFVDNKVSEEIIQEVRDFWTKEKQYNDVRILHRRGFLLYGPQGTGKTSIVAQIIKDVIDQNGIVFMCENPKFFSSGLQLFRKVEPRRKIVCLFEDIDATIKEFGEQDILSILDGEQQVNHVFNLATTNYPEVLDKRIVSRPRRFDRVIKIFPPSYKARFAYFKSKLKGKDKPEEWAKKTEGMSFAALAELIVARKCFNEPFKKAIERLSIVRTPDSEDDDQGEPGFMDK